MDETRKGIRLMMFTQKLDLNDDVLGFAHRWVEELAGNVAYVHLIASRVGEFALPPNVRVYSLGKESNVGKLRRIFRVFAYSLRLLLGRDVDAVFAHQIQHFVLATGLFAKVCRIPVFLFYAHGAVPLSLRFAAPICSAIFTSTKEGLRIDTPRKVIIGQGIDTTSFPLLELAEFGARVRLLLVGRISPVKDQETLVRAAGILRDEYSHELEVILVGRPLNGHDLSYKEKLMSIVRDAGLEDCVRFAGSVPNRMLARYYADCHFVVNPSRTGSLDKVVLEAMSCGRLPLVCDEAISKEFDMYSDHLLFRPADPRDLAEKIVSLMNMGPERLRHAGRLLRKNVETRHALPSLMEKLVQEIKAHVA